MEPCFLAHPPTRLLDGALCRSRHGRASSATGPWLSAR